MTIPTNWPNPERPGVPLFADRDGAHTFEYDNDRDLLVVYHWDSNESCWLEFPKGSSKEWDKRPDLDGLKYHGPVLTPTQIAEMLAEEQRVRAEIDDEVKKLRRENVLVRERVSQLFDSYGAHDRPCKQFVLQAIDAAMEIE